MKTFIKNLQNLAILLIILVVAVSCKDDEDDLKAGWSKILISESVTECSTGADALTEEQCSCFINAAAKEYTLTEFINYDETTSNQAMIDRLTELGISCGFPTSEEVAK